MPLRFLPVFLAFALATPLAMAEDLTVYSSRKAHLIQPVLDLYTQATGVAFNLHTGKPGPLLERLSSTEAAGDLLLTVDAGNLWQAAERDLLMPLDSEVLEQAIPEALRDPQNRWFGFSRRVRTLAYNTNAVTPEHMSTYEALAEESWHNRVCLRTSKKVYNQSLVATLIAHHGEAEAEEIVAGWVANLAVEPFSNDTHALQAVAAGQCDVTLINSYYFGRLMRETPELPLALFWANQEGRGAHVNVSGGGVLRGSKQGAAAQAFLEWLSQEEAQSLFAELNLEYPANPSVAPAEAVQAWGGFQGDTLNLSETGRLQAAAVRLMDRAGWR